MARDGLSIKLEGAAKLDRALAKMAITHQSKTSALVYSALNSGANVTKKAVAKKAPIDKGTLKSSLINGLRRKVRTPRDVFLAAVSFEFKRDKGENTGSGGWTSLFTILGTKKLHPNNFLLKGAKSSESLVRKKIGFMLAKKIAVLDQKIINNAL